MTRLAAASPAPFAAYLRLPDRAVVSNSPERFLKVERDHRIPRELEQEIAQRRHGNLRGDRFPLLRRCFLMA